MRALGLLAIAGGLGACAPSEPGPQFRSAAEEACYAEAQAALTTDAQSLMRDGSGAFRIVTRENGFLRDVDPSPVFDECMARSTQAEEAPRVTEGAPITLSPEEERIWAGLSDARKREALIFMQNGGSLSQFVAG